MFGMTRWSPFEDIFNFQHEVDRLFNRFWKDLPSQTAQSGGSFRVNTTDDGWRIDVPLPGVDPKNVKLEAGGNTLSIRAEQSGDKTDTPAFRFEQTLTIPQFLDVEKLTASHRHGLLRLTLPLKEGVKPRRIEIDVRDAAQKQLTAA